MCVSVSVPSSLFSLLPSSSFLFPPPHVVSSTHGGRTKNATHHLPRHDASPLGSLLSFFPLFFSFLGFGLHGKPVLGCRQADTAACTPHFARDAALSGMSIEWEAGRGRRGGRG